VEYEWSTAEYSGAQQSTAEYEWRTSGVQAEYSAVQAEYRRSTVEYSGVQAEYVKYGGVLECRSPAFSPLLILHKI
jgi:hypothetical protein